MADIWGPNNPGISGLRELTSAELAFIQGFSGLADPNADRLIFWDDSAGEYAFLTLGTNLSITGTTINAAGGGSSTYTIVSQSGASYNATATADVTIILCDCTANAITINLPTAVSNTATYHIKKTDSSANAVTIDANSTETIDGGTTAVISAQYASVQLISDDTNWQVV